jgi:hypothetical protein
VTDAAGQIEALSTSSALPMMEPVIDALTTVKSPARSAMMAGSSRLRCRRWFRAADPSPWCESVSVACPSSGQRQTASAEARGEQRRPQVVASAAGMKERSTMMPVRLRGAGAAADEQVGYGSWRGIVAACRRLQSGRMGGTGRRARAAPSAAPATGGAPKVLRAVDPEAPVPSPPCGLSSSTG